MFVRALVILLLVLNLGVAAWWLLHAASPPMAKQSDDLPLGVVRLQLLREAARPPSKAVAGPAPTAVEAELSPKAAAPASPAKLQCFSFGPFADVAAANAARARLQPLVTRSAVREQRSKADGHGWRVFLPAQASTAQAQAMAQEITAAGFNDLFVVRDGAEANSIALGRYRSEDTARRRAETLVAAGFAARAEPLGDAKLVPWIDVAAASGFDAEGAQKASGAAQRRTVECAAVP